VSIGTRAVIYAMAAAAIAWVVGLAVDKNPWVGIGVAAVVAVVVFFAVNDYYAQPSHKSLPPRAELRTAPTVNVYGSRLIEAGEWETARQLIADQVSFPAIRDPLQRLLQACRSLAELKATLPPHTPPGFRTLVDETVADVSRRLWAKTAIVERLSSLRMPAAAQVELTAEGQRIEEFAQHVEEAATDLLRLSLSGYDALEVSRGTELLSAVRRKAGVLLAVSSEDLG
jgi:hypothetical protein